MANDVEVKGVRKEVTNIEGWGGRSSQVWEDAQIASFFSS